LYFYPGVTLITLGVDSVERASGFYEKLGWRRSQGASQPGITFFSLNTLALALFPRDALAMDSGFAPSSETGTVRFSGVTLAQNHGSKGAVDAVIDEARLAGAKIIRAPCATDWGGHHGIFADPDHHIWEICYNPFFPLAVDGTVTLPP
jgi:catechol 2,3-dioxygenase-like lactoylglutathione lyase family enzyme